MAFLTLKIVYRLEDSKTSLMKIEPNIVLIKTWKQEQVTPTFAKAKLSIKNGNKKLTKSSKIVDGNRIAR